MSTYDLLGIGIGPFNLSLAALLDKAKSAKFLFLDDKPEFTWHKELMFKDATMQTSFLKDLVTPVDPTSPYTFLNYLVEKGQFYHFLNTGRKSINRVEFEDYCKWVSKQLGASLKFGCRVQKVVPTSEGYTVYHSQGSHQAKALCVASGPVPNIPECAKPHLGANVFHAKSAQAAKMNLEGKRLVVVGGGQTGVELFRNALKGQWGRPQSVRLLTGRENLRPLDEGPFTNELFTPEFVSEFYQLPQSSKDEFSERLLLASDGNTPEYLQDFYNDLYLERFYFQQMPEAGIYPMRWMTNLVSMESGAYQLKVDNRLQQKEESFSADIVVLATGFRSQIPQFLQDIEPEISKDFMGRPVIGSDYRLQMNSGLSPIYMMNFSRHGPGVADPQTSLMSWRSAVIANKVLGNESYRTSSTESKFVHYHNPIQEPSL